MVPANHSAAGDVDCQPAAGSGCAEGTDHDSTNRVVPETSVGSLAKDWYANVYYSLSLKPPPLGLHLLTIVVNNNSAIHQRLKIGVGIGHKLELQTIIQTFEKAALLVSIISHFIWSIT